MFDGATALNTGSNVPSFASTLTTADVTYTLDTGGLVIPKGTVKTIALKCNISSSANGITYRWGITAHGTTAQSGTGLTSGTAATVTTTALTGPSMAVTTGGSLAASGDSSAPAFGLIAAGTTGWTANAVRFTATNEDISLQYVSLTLTAGAAADLTNVYIYDGSNLLGQGIFAGASATTVITLNTPVTIPANSYKVLTIKADANTIDANSAATRDGALEKINWLSYVSAGYTRGIGLASATTINAAGTGTTTVSGKMLYKSYPTFAKIAVPSTTLVAGTMDLYRFSIVASPATGNGIGLDQITVSIATSTDSAASGSTTVTAIKVYAYTDVNFSTPVSQSDFTNGLLNTAPTLSTAAASVSGIKIPFLAALQIPAGQTIYFRVTATVSLQGGTGTFAGSITTYVMGDTGLITLGSAGYYRSSTTPILAASSTVWSSNSTTTTALAGDDWTNGYGISGLPSTGMDSVTISK